MDPIRQNGGHVPQQFAYGNTTGAQPDPSNFGVQFSNPWKAGTNPTSAPYPGMTSTTSDLSAAMKHQQQQHQQHQHQQHQHQPTIRQNNFLPSAFPATYAEQPSTSSPTARGAASSYGMGAYGSYEHSPNKNNLYSTLPSFLADDRRFSHPALLSPIASSLMDSPLEPLRQRHASLVDYTRPSLSAGSYHTADALDSARGMLALNQNATRFGLPHSGHRASSSASSSSYYPQSTSSSISSASSYPYYSGSMDSTATDITSISDMYDAARPNLPRPLGLIHSQMMGGHSNGQAAMMSQFSSRVQSSTTKKHKCKVCDKRFTRPSSLQTHMYSHTGEKPFACEVEGCGRQFSVVSNLRRHRKVHKGHSDTETISNSGSV
ncbi:hypothetical protein DRE_00990 [Drechslerella stenobrocha 248]|uniref:C2H2-type domain-containing protein n=1 Tax=Drechslerella stenobrocha 248 TaxID=1043628 RepID=W7HLQ1_9PEZI|nr:hypothetical protein DRE_00990 [Drechslerella stenobrocha 248]